MIPIGTIELFDEWADLLTSPEFTDGHEAQRIRVRITAGAQS